MCLKRADPEILSWPVGRKERRQKEKKKNEIKEVF